MKNLIKNLNKTKNQNSPKLHWCIALLLAMSLALPIHASANSIDVEANMDLDEDDETSIYQERYERTVNTPYQEEVFEQNQLSYGTPSSRRPQFNNFYAAEVRAYKSREEERYNKQHSLEMEILEAELNQRNLDMLEQQQESEGLAGYSGGEGFTPSQPPVIVDNQNNTQVIINLGLGNSKNLTQSGGNNELGLLQLGDNNQGNIDQVGENNSAAIAQIGGNNSASINQLGSNNSSTIDIGE